MLSERTKALDRAMQVKEEIDRAKQQLEHRADHDALTGLINRSRFDALIQHKLAACELAGDRLALLYLDIDEFKQINDVHGHAIGDELLCLFAERLKAGLRELDLVARVGGDEFAAVLDGIDPDRAWAIAKELVNRLSRPYVIEHLTLQVSASIGVAAYPASGATAQTLLKAGDAAMYAAKHRGKRQCVPFAG
jgi:diguanylate cyclase (GGDEF)-like protein